MEFSSLYFLYLFLPLTLLVYFLVPGLRLSVATSFLAAALTMLRSSYYGLGYAANDIVLVVLWVLASCEDPAYIPVAVNFGIFLFHDFYGFLSWKKRERHMAQTA